MSKVLRFYILFYFVKHNKIEKEEEERMMLIVERRCKRSYEAYAICQFVRFLLCSLSVKIAIEFQDIPVVEFHLKTGLSLWSFYVSCLL